MLESPPLHTLLPYSGGWQSSCSKDRVEGFQQRGGEADETRTSCKALGTGIDGWQYYLSILTFIQQAEISHYQLDTGERFMTPLFMWDQLVFSCKKLFDKCPGWPNPEVTRLYHINHTKASFEVSPLLETVEKL